MRCLPQIFYIGQRPGSVNALFGLRLFRGPAVQSDLALGPIRYAQVFGSFLPMVLNAESLTFSGLITAIHERENVVALGSQGDAAGLIALHAQRLLGEQSTS